MKTTLMGTEYAALSDEELTTRYEDAALEGDYRALQAVEQERTLRRHKATLEEAASAAKARHEAEAAAAAADAEAERRAKDVAASRKKAAKYAAAAEKALEEFGDAVRAILALPYLDEVAPRARELITNRIQFVAGYEMKLPALRTVRSGLDDRPLQETL